MTDPISGLMSLFRSLSANVAFTRYNKRAAGRNGEIEMEKWRVASAGAHLEEVLVSRSSRGSSGRYLIAVRVDSGA